jgi:hypothetical protein
MSLTKTNTPGTGNSKVRVPKYKMVDLNNTAITTPKINKFLQAVKKTYNQTDSIKVVVSNRKTVRRWGTANILENKIILYRHSVWVFLHELAHLIEKPVRVNGRWDAHGQKFGNALTELVKIWEQETV